MVRRFVCCVVKNGLFSAAVLGASVVLPCATSIAGVLTPAAPVRERNRDQLWVVSCRGAAFSASESDSTALHYWAYRPTGAEGTGAGGTGAGGTWQSATSEDFAASAPPLAITCVLVLGNGYTAAETQAMGQKAYRHLISGLPVETTVRFVVWSWPSDHTDAGPIRDLRIKAGRTWQVARSLAHWLDAVEPGRTVELGDRGAPAGRLSLLGTSFGARIVMEALELRAVSPDAVRGSPTRPGVNVVLVSAAVDNDWLLPGRELDMALSQVDRLLLVNNTSDRVLKRYHWLYGRRSTATALGNSGLPAGVRFGPVAEKITQYDAASIVGRQHGCGPYFESPRLVALMQRYLFQDGASAEPPSTSPSTLGQPLTTKGKMLTFPE